MQKEESIICYLSITKTWNLYWDLREIREYPKGNAFENEEATFLGSANAMEWGKNLQWIFVYHTIFWTIFFFTLGRLICRWMDSSNNPIYLNLPQIGKNAWINRTVSCVHATLILSGALYELILDDCDRILWNNPLYGSTISAEIIMCITMGYCIYDLFDCIIHPTVGLISIAIHHIAVFSCLIASVTFHIANIWAMLMLLTEATTPILHLRWFLLKYNMENTKAYTFTGVALIGGFIIFRILVQLILFLGVYLHFDDCSKHHKALVISFLSQIISLFILNCYWLYLILSGALAIIASWNKKKQ